MPDPRPAIPAETRATIVAAVRSGTPYRQVATTHGVTLGLVSSTVRAARRLGELPPAGPPLCPVPRGPCVRTPEDVAKRAARKLRQRREQRARAALTRAPREVLVQAPTPRRPPNYRPRGHSWVKVRPYTPPNAWQPEDDDTLVRRTLAGDTRADIGAGLGRTASAVESRQGVMRAAGRLPRLPDRSWSVADDAMLAELRADGLPEREVALRLGRSQGAVSCRVNKLARSGVRLGRARGDYRWTPEAIALVRRLARAGGTPEEIAPAVGRSVAVVKLRIRDMRLDGSLPPLEPPDDEADDENQPDRVRYPRPGADPLLAALMAAHAPR